MRFVCASTSRRARSFWSEAAGDPLVAQQRFRESKVLRVSVLLQDDLWAVARVASDRATLPCITLQSVPLKATFR